MYELKYKPFDMLHKSVDPFEFNGKIDPVETERLMIEIMLKHNGIGIAANQIGLNSQVFIIGSNEIPGFIKPQAFFNPIITKVSVKKNTDYEGCLSFPNLMLKIKRYDSIEVSYQDIKGEWTNSKLNGYLARVFQHEFDHLNGICFNERAEKFI